MISGTAYAGPVVDIMSTANSTAAPGGTLDYYVWIGSVGDEPTSDEMTVVATLPSGVVANSAVDWLFTGWDCDSFTTYPASVVTCKNSAPADPKDLATRNGEILISTDVDPGASGVLTALFDVTGGGAPSASTADPTTITATPPGFGIDAFDGQVTANASADPFTQAGGHPYAASTAILFNTITNPNPFKGATWPVEAVKDIQVELPPGLVGDPTATGESRCTLEQLANSEGVVAKPFCPPGSQVGVTTLLVADAQVLTHPMPVFNMVAPPGVPARFGFNVAGTVITLNAALRSDGDYGLSVNVQNVSEGLAAVGTVLTFWGVPSDPSHNLERACPGQQGPAEGGPSCTTELPQRAFLRNPTSCTAPGQGLETTVRVDSWTDPGDFVSASFTTHNPPAFPFPPDQWGTAQGTTGCDQVPFEPSLSGAPTVGKAGAPSGFTFDLSLPQSDDPDRIGTADLKKAVVTLPVGLRVSPSAAAGLGACAPEQIGLHSTADATCPGSSKVGTIEIDTPLLDDPLTGSIYLAKPHDNPFGSLLSIYLVAKGPGLIVKLPGRVDADPLTGQLSATFDDNPQLPFSNLHLEFNGGPRAPLVNPPTCGTYTTHAVLSSWSGATVASDSQFAISRDGNGTPCAAAQFSPDFSAGGSSTVAGKHTTFHLRLARDDDDEEIDSLSVTTPTGLLAKVAGVPLCPADKAKAGACEEASRIGDVLTGAGAGTNPFFLPGRVYLTDAYKGGPFGLSIVVPAVAGPFDLGTVAVRASIQVDKRTSQLKVVSDPLPRILEGIPLQVRDIRVSIDRSAFMINPTSCLQKQVTGSVTSTAGTTVGVADRFQVGGCRQLKLRPRLRIVVGSKGHTRPGSSTPLTAKLTQTPGQSNLKSVSVTLPLSLNALLPVVNEACTQAEFDAGNCEKARTGSAVAVTPLLDEPLEGSAYFVKRATGKGLPNLVVALRGQVDFDLVGTIKIPGGTRLSTRFSAPDVPIESFSLKLAAGKDGALGVAENLCTKKSRRGKAQIVFRGQNGAVVRADRRLHVRGCRTGTSSSRR
ncbi:MAG: hypothetical protein WBD55_04155 [Dehalococcoidia bacterium]